MTEIELTQSKVALVDDDIYEYLSQWEWCATKTQSGKWYAVRNRRKGEDGASKIYMHHAVYEYYFGDDVDEVDHIDSDGFNNVKQNLRSATGAQNSYNKSKSDSPTTSTYKGVCWSTYRKKWQAYIRVKGVQHHLAFCEDEQQAALLYNQKAVELFGEFAKVNVV